MANTRVRISRILFVPLFAAFSSFPCSPLSAEEDQPKYEISREIVETTLSTQTISLKKMIKEAEKKLHKVNQLIQEQKKEEAVEELIQKGNQLNSSGDLEEARKYWEKAYEISKDPAIKAHLSQAERVATEKQGVLPPDKNISDNRNPAVKTTETLVQENAAAVTDAPKEETIGKPVKSDVVTRESDTEQKISAPKQPDKKSLKKTERETLNNSSKNIKTNIRAERSRATGFAKKTSQASSKRDTSSSAKLALKSLREIAQTQKPYEPTAKNLHGNLQKKQDLTRLDPQSLAIKKQAELRARRISHERSIIEASRSTGLIGSRG